MAEKPIRADRVRTERIDWLWRERIPQGMISVVAGRPDQGKGLFVAHVAAEASRRGIKVLYSAAEDSHGQMTRPRLKAAGAKMSNIHLWRFSLPRDMAALEAYVTKGKIGLVVMDPLAAHLGGGISRHSDNIRSILQPLTALIERTGTAVVIVEHALKRIPANGHILNVIGGSGSGLPAATRAAYVFGVDPRDDTRRILATAKFNLGEKPNALAFEVDTVTITPDPGDDDIGEMAALVFDEELTAFDPMTMFTGTVKGSIGRPPDKRAEACQWLSNYLALARKPVKASVVFEDAKQYGMSNKTLQRAAADMGIVKQPPGGGKNVTWDLPPQVKKAMHIEEVVVASEGEEKVPETKDVLAELEAMLKAESDQQEGGDDRPS